MYNHTKDIMAELKMNISKKRNLGDSDLALLKEQDDAFNDYLGGDEHDVEELDEEDDAILSLVTSTPLGNGSARKRSKIEKTPVAKVDPPRALVTTAPRIAYKQLKEASYYKSKMLSEMKMRRNIHYITGLVDGVVARNDSTMSVSVPINIIRDEETVEELLRLKFKLNPKLVDSVCYCGASSGECEAVKNGMPTETCTPPVCEVSWLDAEIK